MTAHISIPEPGLTIELDTVDYRITEAPEGRTSVTITGYARSRILSAASCESASDVEPSVRDLREAEMAKLADLPHEMLDGDD